MCRDPPACGNVRSFPPIIDYNAKTTELLARHRETQEAIARRQPVDPVWKRALWRFQLYLLVRRTIRQLYGRIAPREPDPNDLEDPGRLGWNLEALAGIRRDFPELPITLAHFPQIDDLQAGRYQEGLEEHASRLGIDYFSALTRCSWSADMYHTVNLHPNAAGCDNFARCLSRHLRMAE